MTDTPEKDDFIWLDGRPCPPDDMSLRHVVGIVTSPAEIMRYWEKSRDSAEGRLDVMRPGQIGPWLNCSTSHKLHLINKAHPDYDRWWAWHCACEMGVVIDPEMINE